MRWTSKQLVAQYKRRKRVVGAKRARAANVGRLKPIRVHCLIGSQEVYRDILNVDHRTTVFHLALLVRHNAARVAAQHYNLNAMPPQSIKFGHAFVDDNAWTIDRVGQMSRRTHSCSFVVRL